MHKDKKQNGGARIKNGGARHKDGSGCQPKPNLMGLFLFLFLPQSPHHHATTPRHYATVGGPASETRSHRRQPSPEVSLTRTQVPKSSCFVSSPTSETMSWPPPPDQHRRHRSSPVVSSTSRPPSLGPTVAPPPPLEASTRHWRCRRRLFFVSWFFTISDGIEWKGVWFWFLWLGRDGQAEGGRKGLRLWMLFEWLGLFLGLYFLVFTQVSNEDKTRNRNFVAFMMVLYGSHYSIMEK